MKKLLILLFVLPIVVSAQTHQTEIVSFVSNNVGKKVGHGVCYELIQSAIRQYNPKYDMGAIRKDCDRYGKLIRKKNVMPGDIIHEYGKKIDHVAIVYKTDGDQIFIAQQNTGKSLKESIVVISLLDLDRLKEKYGKVKVYFYRPK